MTARLVTVVIPAADEENFIGPCLDSVLAQDYRDLQVVVVDGCSTDLTVQKVLERQRLDKRVELLRNDRRNIPSSLNLALAAARGTWLVRVDAHCTIPPSYVSTAVRNLEDGNWGGVGGRKDGVGRTPAGRAIGVAMSSRLAVGNSTYHFGTTRQEVEHLPFGAYPTELVRRLGGWDEMLTANEDFEFDYRVRATGERLLFDPAMSIAWHCRQSIRDLFGQYVRYGRGKADVAVRHPMSLSPRHVAPPAFLGYLLAALLVGSRRPTWAGAMLTPYLVTLQAEAVRLGPRLKSTRERVQVPVAIAAMHLGWGLGFWSGLRANVADRLRGEQGEAVKHG